MNTNPDYYPVALKADRIIDLAISADGLIELDLRTRSPQLLWTGLAALPSRQLAAGETVEFTLSIAENQEALFAVQARDWPSGYIPPKLTVLGKLNPMSGNGEEVLTSNNVNTYKTHVVDCSFSSDGVLTTRLYRYRRDAHGQPQRDPQPAFVETFNLPALRDGPYEGEMHVALRLPPGVTGNLKFTTGDLAGQSAWSL